MTTYIYGPTPGRAWLNRMASRDGAAHEAVLNPRLALPLKRKGARKASK